MTLYLRPTPSSPHHAPPTHASIAVATAHAACLLAAASLCLSLGGGCALAAMQPDNQARSFANSGQSKREESVRSLHMGAPALPHHRLSDRTAQGRLGHALMPQTRTAKPKELKKEKEKPTAWRKQVDRFLSENTAEEGRG
ncbi:unnamed protein product [Pleuronectes platessa]|uniref:Transmembrane protein n=1 Tax=Pleuronectes platessa TaxID=8262 RepID=A0A9N7TH81_PLEPL|nr:unnamed protein product [Pleuronectes platessa]